MHKNGDSSMFLLLLLSEANNIVGLHKTLGSRLTKINF